MTRYYSEKLSAERLKRVYDVAPPRTVQYLKAEIEFVAGKIKQTDVVLDLGCGYGRVIPTLAKKGKFVVGIDASPANLQMGQEVLKGIGNCCLIGMDALHLAFRNNLFDIVICIQNGISAFHVEQKELIKESIRVTKPGGTILYSTYAEKFWKDRLEWFERQAAEGLLGEINYEQTGNGVIVCKDGFRATTFTTAQFRDITSDLNVRSEMIEVDQSSLFCVMMKI